MRVDVKDQFQISILNRDHRNFDEMYKRDYPQWYSTKITRDISRTSQEELLYFEYYFAVFIET